MEEVSVLIRCCLQLPPFREAGLVAAVLGAFNLAARLNAPRILVAATNTASRQTAPDLVPVLKFAEFVCCARLCVRIGDFEPC